MHFEILIRTHPKKVWDAIVEDKKYREWTAAFDPSSRFEGGWNTGERIRFIGIDQQGRERGMLSQIAESRPFAHISIKHLGYIENGIEDTTSEAVRAWAPAYENYTFVESAEGTRFEVDVDVEERFVQMFGRLWPQALQKLKEVAER
jgi:uncharacterized protein YndB with AHSA1/START domain